MILKHLLSSAIPTTFATDGDWMKVIPSGNVKARDGRSFIAGDVKDLEAIIERTLERAGETELMIDYLHERGEAAGWIKKLEAREDGIWALVQWTEEAREKIKTKKFRYLSPYLHADKKTRMAKVLLNVALCNMPALDLEATAAAAELNPKNKESNMDFKKIAKKLGLKEDATEAEILAAIEKMEKPASTDTEKAELVAETLKPVALAAGLDGDADGDAVLVAVTSLANDGSTDVAKMQVELNGVTKELGELKKSGSLKEAEAFVDAEIKAGRVGLKPRRDSYVERFQTDPEGVKGDIAAMYILGESGTTATPPKAPGDAETLTDDQKNAALSMGVSEEDYLKELKLTAA